MLPVARLFDRGKAAIGIHVTGSGAIAQLTYSVINGIGFVGFFMRTPFPVIRMATCTIRLVGRCLPHRSFTIPSMAARACKASVAAWVARGDMIVAHRCPALRGMTGIALSGGNEMVAGLARGRDAIVTAVANTTG